MAVTVRQVEARDGEWHPLAPLGMGDGARALAPGMIWARIEAWVAWRWSARPVVWTVEGEGDWTPPLAPATVTNAEVWERGGWSAVTLPVGPYGYCLPGDGPYRIVATVGGGPVPDDVAEAYRRLAAYSVGIVGDGMVEGHPSHTSHSVNISDAIDESFERSATWAARALSHSGAADLLRPYRRA